MVVGCFLPWLSATVFIGGGLSRNAFQLGNKLAFSIDGVIGVGLGAIAVVIGIVRLTNTSMPRYIQSSSAVVGLGGAILVANRWSSLNALVHKAQNALGNVGTASLGVGIYMVAVGAGLAIIGGIVLRKSTPSQAWSAPTTQIPTVGGPPATPWQQSSTSQPPRPRRLTEQPVLWVAVAVVAVLAVAAVFAVFPHL